MKKIIEWIKAKLNIRSVVRRANYGESLLIKCIDIIKQQEFLEEQLKIINNQFR